MAKKTKDELLNEYLEATGRGFTYDPEKDPVAMSQKKLYMQEADRQTADTLGKTAAMTGGVPSSYAVSAAAQAGNYQKSKWAAEVPQYEANAYARYRQAAQDKLGAYETVAAAEQQQLQNDRYDKEYADKRADIAWERNYQKEQNDRTAAMNLWKAQGTASPQVAAVLGVPAGAVYGGASDAAGTAGNAAVNPDEEYEAQAAWEKYKKSPEKMTGAEIKLLRDYGYMDADGNTGDDVREESSDNLFKEVQGKTLSGDYAGAIDALNKNRSRMSDQDIERAEETLSSYLNANSSANASMRRQLYELVHGGNLNAAKALARKYAPYLDEDSAEWAEKLLYGDNRNV